MKDKHKHKHIEPNALALLPLLFFLMVFLGSGIYFSLAGVDMAFYQLKAPVAILPAIVLAMCITKNSDLESRLSYFLSGMGELNIISMCVIYLLAGAFSHITAAIGGVDAVATFGVSLLSPEFLLIGIFIASCIVAISMGTSVGTIAAVTPIALGLSHSAGIDTLVSTGAVVGGAMFGDNLSIISDTTIAATRTQGCNMRDKLYANLKLAIPASLITIFLLMLLGDGANITQHNYNYDAWRALPYLIIIILSVAGVNVFVALSSGIIASAVLGILFVENFSMIDVNNHIYSGFVSMQEILLLSMFVGGLGYLMQRQGGIVWLSNYIEQVLSKVNSIRQKSSQYAIVILVSLYNLFLSNNTVSIILSGSVVRDIAIKNSITSKRSACLLDTASCVVQGVIPWGAQLLLAASISGHSPIQLSGVVYYPWILGACLFCSIQFAGVPARIMMKIRGLWFSGT